MELPDPNAVGKLWWWGEGNEQKGPLGTLDMVMQFLSGKINEDTLVWCNEMDDWQEAKTVEELMNLVAMLQRKSWRPEWTAPPGTHEVPPECERWIKSLSQDARVSLFHTAIHKYMPAIVKQDPDARDALLKAFISRHPEMDGDADSFELSDEFLMDVLDQCEGISKGEFEKLLLKGNEAHVVTLLLRAAQLDHSFMTRIHNASIMGEAVQSITAGDTAALMQCLADRPGLIHSRNIDGTCLLHKIVQLDKADMLKAVLEWQKRVGDTLVINFDCRDFSHNTPLHLAASAGNVAMAEMLLESGADINIQNHSKSEYASGQWGVKAQGGDSAVPISPEHATALHIAAEQTDIDMIELLLKYKPDLEVPDSSGMTPLHVAVEAGDDECVEALLAAGANPLSTNPIFGEGVTCLHSAASRGLASIAAAILKHCPQVDVNVPDAEGWRPLHLAARRGSTKILEMLLATGADVSAQNKQGQTALYLAQVNKKTAAIALLETLPA